ESKVNASDRERLSKQPFGVCGLARSSTAPPVITHTPKERCIIEEVDDDEDARETSEKYGRKSIRSDNRRTTYHSPVVSKPIPPPPSVAKCPKSICKEFIKSLRWLEALFDHSGYKFEVPRGWCRFGLKIDSAHSDTHKIWKKWATSYHGTAINTIQIILTNSYIPLEDDVLMNGETFHMSHSDKTHYYTSPSIKYAALPIFTPETSFTSTDNEVYGVQVVLQCKQEPNTFEVQNASAGAVRRIIPRREIEWKSNTRGVVVVPYGLMVCVRRRS
ncbi:unnamed protein product, partial [Didymodactylos carnosus]